VGRQLRAFAEIQDVPGESYTLAQALQSQVAVDRNAMRAKMLYVQIPE